MQFATCLIASAHDSTKMLSKDAFNGFPVKSGHLCTESNLDANQVGILTEAGQLFSTIILDPLGTYTSMTTCFLYHEKHICKPKSRNKLIQERH